jgi:hypothetical protein
VNDSAKLPVSRRDFIGRVVSCAPRYEISDDGRIWSHITRRFVRAFVRRDGYLYVMLREDGRNLNLAVHRLVATAWIGEPLLGEQVNHKSLTKTDNRVENLEWVTPAENSRHAWRTLPQSTIARLRERRSFGAKKMNRMKRQLSDSDVAAIRAALTCGKSRTSIAPRFGVSRTTIDNIANGRIYVD